MTSRDYSILLDAMAKAFDFTECMVWRLSRSFIRRGHPPSTRATAPRWGSLRDQTPPKPKHTYPRISCVSLTSSIGQIITWTRSCCLPALSPRLAAYVSPPGISIAAGESRYPARRETPSPLGKPRRGRRLCGHARPPRGALPLGAIATRMPRCRRRLSPASAAGSRRCRPKPRCCCCGHGAGWRLKRERHLPGRGKASLLCPPSCCCLFVRCCCWLDDGFSGCPGLGSGWICARRRCRRRRRRCL